MEQTNDRHRNEDGTFGTEHADAEYIAAIEDMTAVSTTAKVAEAVGVHIDTARGRLKELVDEGAVVSTTAGRTKVWSVAEESDR